jgi:hypothetical protein
MIAYMALTSSAGAESVCDEKTRAKYDGKLIRATPAVLLQKIIKMYKTHRCAFDFDYKFIKFEEEDGDETNCGDAEINRKAQLSLRSPLWFCTSDTRGLCERSALLVQLVIGCPGKAKSRLSGLGQKYVVTLQFAVHFSVSGRRTYFSSCSKICPGNEPQTAKCSCPSAGFEPFAACRRIPSKAYVNS